jgi:U3 small nucleolar RNA-associated protein 20
VITPLLKVHLRSQVSVPTHTCLRRLLTALIHHCKTAVQFLPVSKLLVEELISTARSVESNEHTDPLNRLVEIIAVVSSVRQGSRMTGAFLSTFSYSPALTYLQADHLSTISTALSSLVGFSSLEKPLLHASVSVLMAGDVSLWMGAGRNLVEQSWTNTTFGAQLCGILSGLSWGGWKLLELSHVTKYLSDLLDSDPLRGLVLLAELYRAQRLGSVPITWLQQLEERILTRFDGCAITPEKVRSMPSRLVWLLLRIQ